MKIKEQWNMGTRKAEVFVSPMDKGLIYVLIRWSSRLTLVLDTLFFKSEHADINAQEIQKAHRLVERINVTGVISIKNWRRCNPLPAGAKTIARPFLSEYASYGSYTAAQEPVTAFDPYDQPFYGENEVPASDYEFYAQQSLGDEVQQSSEGFDTNATPTEAQWQVIRANLRSQYREAGQQAVRRCFKKSNKPKSSSDRPQPSSKSSASSSGATWKLGNRKAEVFVSDREEGLIYVYVKWSEKMVLVHQHVFLKGIKGDILEAQQLADMINQEGTVSLSEYDRCAPAKDNNGTSPYSYKYKQKSAA